MIWIDFDDIWQKYAEDSRREYACFSFHVGLLVITLSSRHSLWHITAHHYGTSH